MSTELFAENVRQAISKATGIPTATYSVENLLLCRRVKKLSLPYSAGLVSFSILQDELQYVQCLSSSVLCICWCCVWCSVLDVLVCVCLCVSVHSTALPPQSDHATIEVLVREVFPQRWLFNIPRLLQLSI